MRAVPYRGVSGVLAALVLVAVGCSSSKSSATRTTTTTSAAAAGTGSTTSSQVSVATTSTPATTGQPSTTAAASGGLSGTWSGQYAGANQGTFKLTWQQTGSDITGKITLAGVDVPIDVTGTVQGSAIRFGSVAQGAVSYTGTVSGNTMSGTYQAPNGTGTWSATKGS